MPAGKDFRKIIGLVPAGGRASRIAPLPCSKELFPLGFHALTGATELRPKVVSHYLLERMRAAGIKKAYIILRRGKWDIPAYFGDGKIADMHLAYLMMDLPFGVPFTLDQAYPFVKDAVVALGFPDLIFYPEDAYVKLLRKLDRSGADIILGLFPPHKPHKTDMVEIDAEGRISEIHIKPEKSPHEYAWEIALWTPVFTEYLHEFLRRYVKRTGTKDRSVQKLETEELHVADVIKSALRDNIRVDSVLFKDGHSMDIGTPEDLKEAVCRLSETPQSSTVNASAVPEA